MALNGKTLTRADLAEAVFEKVGLPRNEAAELVELVLKQIVYALERGEPIKLSSFGSFGLRQKSERVGRNPKTGEIVPITPRRVIVFKASNIMKDRINAGLAKVVSPPPAVKATATKKAPAKAGAKAAAASKADDGAKPKPAKASAKAAPVEEKAAPEHATPKVEAKPKAAKADVAKAATKAVKEPSPKAAASSESPKTKADDAAPKRAPKTSSAKKRVVSS